MNICFCDHSYEDHEDTMAPQAPAQPVLPDKGGCPITDCMKFLVGHLHMLMQNGCLNPTII